MAESDAAAPRPLTITVRIIKSFEYRNFRNLVLHGAERAPTDGPRPDFTLDTTVAELKTFCKERTKTAPGFKPYANAVLDTMKLYFHAHGQKTSNLVINVDAVDVFMEDGMTLRECGIEDETELSFFGREAYEAYKAHPDTKW
ncbi:hypothetical protein DFJ74DRAFT_606249 [Hyaloraphidium curvatum]|nr:hypothetical protein DFJ74DRAFT_606249 [Hyaloraphidium curvatum]